MWATYALRRASSLRLAIELLAGQPQSSLIEKGDVLVGLLGVGIDKDAEQARHADALKGGQFANESGLVLDGRDGVQFRLNRLQAELFGSVLVHE